ncbi:MAG TPA: ankyrin repeat domain-containing protein, partial [Verrucomicrobiae bacterium]|nr:ankyrin repeat domain-containing protein [Verrucomicrobiae bacterium]
MVRLPGNPFSRLEELIIEGLDFLGQTPPNLPAAAKCLSAAEAVAATKELPERLACRMRFFRDAVERIRKDMLRDCVGRELNGVKPLLEDEPPSVDRAAEELQVAAALLKEAPDPYLQNELEALRQKVGVLEKKLQRRRAVVKWTLPSSIPQIARATLQAAPVLLAVGGILLGSWWWLTRPGIGSVASVKVKVVPPGAQLFTNGVAVGNQAYPVELTGFTGDKMDLEARLAGYTTDRRSLVFPAVANANQTIELQPLPATLVVKSEPAAQQIWVRPEGEQSLAATNADQGVAVKSGVAMEISLNVPDYAPVSRTIAALKSGERCVIDFGALTILPGALRTKVEPADATFSIVYPGQDPVSFGSTNYLAGLAPKKPFKLIAERKGYISVTNSFNLNPGQTFECDLGHLQPAPASLMVLALPRPFQIQVEWDGQPRNFGVTGEAAGLPPGKPLVVTVSADGCEAWSTNIVLEPAEKRTLALGRLPLAQGYLLVKCDPADAVVSYRVDGGMETVIGVTDTIPSLPLGHQVFVTVNKPGYLPVTKSLLFERAGESVDFGALKPSVTLLTGQLYRAAQLGDVEGIQKILARYSKDYPLLVDQPYDSEGDAPTPLLAAVRKGQLKAVDFLVKSGADVNRANRFRVTPLFEAARKGDVAMVKTLLDAHADVRFRNLSGQTPMFAVVLSSRNVEVVNLLMAFGADPNVRDISGETPLLLAEENQ